MIAGVENFLVKAAIQRALNRKAPDTIPLSGMERLRRRDYYTARLRDDSTGENFSVTGVRQEGLDGYWFSGVGSGREASVPTRFIRSLRLEITHYAQELELRYDSPIGFFWSALTFKARREVWRFRFRVWAFSKKRLPRRDRMEILTWAYNWTLENESRRPSFSPLSFLIHKHGNLIIYHPEKDRLMRYYRVVFESLVASGDLNDIKASWSFCLSPKALDTLDRYEETDRRHADNLRQQRILGWLTFALVLIGAGQIIVAFFE